MKKMIIVGGLVVLLFIGLMGGKHVSRTSTGEEVVGGYEGEWTESEFSRGGAPGARVVHEGMRLMDGICIQAT